MVISSAFLSYAHMDAKAFADRLVFALQMYRLDVFWDKRAQIGNFHEVFHDEIKKRDIFMIILSPYALRADSYCQIELRHANEYKKPIIPIRISKDFSFTDSFLVENDSPDFCEDFEIGFRKLTQQIFGQPYSSWEYATQVQNDRMLLDILEHGRLPGIIAREIADWVIVEKLWQYCSQDVSKHYTFWLTIPIPRTPLGIFRLKDLVLENLKNENDIVRFRIFETTFSIVETYIKNTLLKKDEEHELMGASAAKVIADTKDLISDDLISSNKVPEYVGIVKYHDFNVAEKLRELITLHSRRSRYLY